MGLLTREQIFGAPKRSYKDVSCPEVGGKIRVQSLTGQEFEDWQESNRDPKKKDKDGNPVVNTKGSIVRLLVRCLVDKEGNRIMSDDDYLEFTKINAAVLNRLGTVALKLNGVGEKEIDELVKNSEAVQTEEGPSS